MKKEKTDKMTDPQEEIDCPICKHLDEPDENCEYCFGSGLIDPSQQDSAQDDYEADWRMDSMRDQEL